MSFQDFELIPDKPFIVRCKFCKKEIPTGIISISEHWNNCSGKGFKDSLIASHELHGKITMEDLSKVYDELMEMRKGITEIKYIGDYVQLCGPVYGFIKRDIWNNALMKAAGIENTK